MPRRDIKKILIGIFFIGLSLFCIATGFYYMNFKPGLASRDVTSSPVPKQNEKKDAPIKEDLTQDAGIASEASQPAQEGSTTDKEEVISLDSLIEAATTAYGEEERAKKEGYLWIDKKSAKYIITLGGINGLKVGTSLGLYDGQDKIGQVKVEMPFDVISYVQLVDVTQDTLQKDYYRVLIE